MGVNPGLLDTYYVLGTVSAILNMLVVLLIVGKLGFRTAPMKLVLYLHSTLVVESITTLPKLFVGTGICGAVGFLRTYAGLANYIAVLILVLHYRITFKVGWHRTRHIILTYREHLIFLFPLITVFPFTTSSYGIYEDDWCELHTDYGVDRLWSFLVYYGWVMGISLASTVVLYITCLSVYRAHPKLMWSMFHSSGLYVVLAILSWIPRLFAFMKAIPQDMTYLFIYVFGIGYVLVFRSKRSSLEEFERTSATLDSECESYFCWDLGLSDSMHSSMVGSERAISIASASAMRNTNVQMNPMGSSSRNSSALSSGVSSARQSDTILDSPADASGGNLRPSSSLSNIISAARSSRVDRPSIAKGSRTDSSTSSAPSPPPPSPTVLSESGDDLPPV